MSSPMTNTLGSRSISWAIASEIAFEVVSRRFVATAIASSSFRSREDVLECALGSGVWAGPGEPDRLVDLGLRRVPDRLRVGLAHRAGLGQPQLQPPDGIPFLEPVHLLLGPVELRVSLEV